VTGVQTCALPILIKALEAAAEQRGADAARADATRAENAARAPSAAGSTGPRALSKLSSEARNAVDPLTRIWLEDLESPAIESRTASAQYFGRSGHLKDASVVVAALVETMNDPEWKVRFTATIALGDIGEAAAPAL